MVSIVSLFLMTNSCKKTKVPALVDKISFVLNQKIAYSIAEDILVTNKSIGSWAFEWYIDDKLVSKNIILTKDQLQNTTKNVKHELKLVGVNTSGNISVHIDTFEYRDTMEFNSLKFSNYSSSFVKILTEDTVASFVALDLRKSSTAFGRVEHYPPFKNCLISYAWNLDSFKTYENKFFNPRFRDFPYFVNPSSIKKSYISTDIFNVSDNLYCLFGSKMRNDLSGYYQGSSLSGIKDIKYDKINKLIIIKTSQLDIALKM